MICLKNDQSRRNESTTHISGKFRMNVLLFGHREKCSQIPFTPIGLTDAD